MNTEEHKFLWEMREFAKSHAGKLISREFLGRTHPISGGVLRGTYFTQSTGI